MKSCLKIGGIGFILLIGLVITIAIFGSDEQGATQSRSSTQSGSTSSNATPTRFPIESLDVLSVDEIEAWVEKNELDFEESVSDKWVGVRGKVNTVEEATFGTHINVSLSPIQNEWSLFSVVCELPESDRSVATGLSKDQVITVSGIAGKVIVGLSVTIDECKYEPNAG